MPLMDGFQATERIRRSQSKEELPIIALTASQAEGDPDRCLDAGMNGQIQQASADFHACQGHRTLGTDPRVEALGSSGVEPATPSSSGSRDGAPLGVARWRRRRLHSRGDGQLCRSASSVRDRACKLRSLRQDVDAVQSLAHSMKGASKQIGATRAGSLLGAIEAQDDLDASAALLDELDEEVPRVESAVNALLRRSARAS